MDRKGSMARRAVLIGTCMQWASDVGRGGRAVPVCATGHGLTASFGQIWTPWPYFQLKKAHTDGPSGRPSVKQATTQCCPRTPIESVYCIRKLPVPWCQITKATLTCYQLILGGHIKSTMGASSLKMRNIRVVVDLIFFSSFLFYKTLLHGLITGLGCTGSDVPSLPVLSLKIRKWLELGQNRQWRSTSLSVCGLHR